MDTFAHRNHTISGQYLKVSACTNTFKQNIFCSRLTRQQQKKVLSVCIFAGLRLHDDRKLAGSLESWTWRRRWVLDASATITWPWPLTPKPNQFMFVPRCKNDKSSAKIQSIKGCWKYRRNFLFQTHGRTDWQKHAKHIASGGRGLQIQESCAIAKMTAQCTIYMGALKIFGTPWVRPRLLFPTFFTGFCSDRTSECSYKIWSP